MRKILVILFILTSQTIQAKKEFLVSLSHDSIQWKNLGFYIAGVEDQRSDQSNIGFVWKGLLEKKTPAKFKDGLSTTLNQYMNHLIVKASNSIPIIIV